MVERSIGIGNCSGFYGDRLSAMREMLEGSNDGQPLDYLTGDYLAELTMLILGKDQLKDPGAGYARTFVRQLEDCLGLALEKGVRIVSNAGGLNPAGLAVRVGEIANALGLSPRISWVDGDDLAPRAAELGFEGALTANAYLGGFGIARALEAGADVVITGRVTDASLVVGPAVAEFGWTPTSYDELAGAVVAGHVIECGAQATGGNFDGAFEVWDWGMRPFGFPIAEVAADGSSVITKHPGTGGLVSVDTVTAQLMYEIQGPLYLGPDVTADLTSIQLSQLVRDRVQIRRVSGSAPPERLKVAVNELGGYRNSVEFVLTGLDLGAKRNLVMGQVLPWLNQMEDVDSWWSDYRVPAPDSPIEEGASVRLRLDVFSRDAEAVGKRFTAPIIEIALASYAGFHVTAPPARPSPFGVYKPAYVGRDVVEETVHLAWTGQDYVVPAPSTGQPDPAAPVSVDAEGFTLDLEERPLRGLPLGTFVHARSGDKGGDANVGFWVSQNHPKAAERTAWLLATVDPAFIRGLIPEAAGSAVDVTALPSLGGVNVVVHGWLGAGVAANHRFDPQAKALGEWLRYRHVEIPEELL